MTENNGTPKTNTFSEAPASWNARYTLNGFDCQITLRGETGTEVLTRALAALDFLVKQGATPSNGHTQPPAPAAATPAPVMDDGSPDPSWCALHRVQMAVHTKDGKSWFSHKLDSGE